VLGGVPLDAAVIRDPEIHSGVGLNQANGMAIVAGYFGHGADLSGKHDGTPYGQH
jgi:uncharacterized membrane protein